LVLVFNNVREKGRKMKKVFTGVFALLVLAGCSGPQYNQAEADLVACEIYADITSRYDMEVQDFRVIITEAREVVGGLAQSSGSIALRINRTLWNQPITYINHTVLQNLGDYEDEEFESFVSNHRDIANDCGSLGVNVETDFLDKGKPSPKPEVQLDACKANMKAAANTTDSDTAERYLKATAENCGGASEWYEALRAYPYAMGFPDVMGNELEILCFNYGSSPACKNP
jgi:hypothetical protein